MLKKLSTFIFLFLVGLIGKSFGYALNDFGSVANGNYNSTATWGKWNGASWIAAGAIPSNLDNVYILSGTTVVTPNSGSPGPPFKCKTLNVESGGKIYANGTTNVYLLVYGDIVCDGTIGNGATFDGISFGIESVCTVTGAGTFDASRISKRTGDNVYSKLVISRDINLRFASSSQTQIYNHAATATTTPTRFDVVISAGSTLNLTGNGSTSFGNAAIDGFDGSGAYNGSGSFDIYGTMIVSGTTYLSTNNTGTTFACNTTAGSNSVTCASTASLVVGSTICGTGIYSNCFPTGTYITSIVNSTTFLVSNNALTGVTLSGANSAYVGGSCFWYIRNGGILRTAQVTTSNLTATASTTSGTNTFTITISNTSAITIGSVISGSGILPNTTITSATITSSTATTNTYSIVISTSFTLTTASNSISFGGGTAGHMLKVATGGLFEVTGTSGFNANFTTNNATYDFQNGSYAEYSSPGNQNVPYVPISSCSAFGSSSNSYGYLKISGGGTKTILPGATPAFKIANDLNIVNTSGTPIFNCNNIFIWMTGGNWYNYNQTGFTEGVGTVQFMGSAVQTINTTGGERFYSLNYAKVGASYLQFNCPVNVIFRLTWSTDGPVFLNGNRLTMESALTTAFSGYNALRYIISETVDNSSIVQWNIGTTASALNYLIPFGKPGAPDYIPFTYALASGVTVGNLSVATYGTPANNLPWPISPYAVLNLNSTTGLLPDNRDATVDRFWEIDVTAATAPSADVTFTYAPSELPIVPFNNAALMEAQWYSKSIDKWQPASAGQTKSTYYTTVPGLNTYGAWTLAALTSPLPIKLLSFNAHKNDNVVDLTWTTETEVNNNYFTLERSADGFEFSQIAIVPGAGNSTQELNYARTDYNPLPGVSYYRLKQTDYDGHFSYSNTVAVRFTNSDKPFVSVGPIPARDYVKITTSGEEKYQLSLIQPDGRLVKEFAENEPGVSTLDISDVAPGTYILCAVSAHDQRYLRIIKE